MYVLVNSPVSALDHGSGLELELVPACRMVAAHCSSGMRSFRTLEHSLTDRGQGITCATQFGPAALPLCGFVALLGK